VKLDDGLAFVPLRRDEIYAVRLINRSEFEAAVMLTIDGLSVFAFRESKDPKTDKPLPRYTHIVVPAQGEATVFGWTINDDETDSFQIVALPKGAAAALNVKGEIGTITASFAAAWPKGSNPPPDEGADNTRAADATGRGPRIGVRVEAVVRDIGKVRASVSVRYTK
jgi:hypothetical protein